MKQNVSELLLLILAFNIEKEYSTRKVMEHLHTATSSYLFRGALK